MRERIQRARRGQSPFPAGGGCAAAVLTRRPDGAAGPEEPALREGLHRGCFRSGRSKFCAVFVRRRSGPDGPDDRDREDRTGAGGQRCPLSPQLPSPSPYFIFFPFLPFPFPPIKLYLKCHLNYEIVAENCA